MTTETRTAHTPGPWKHGAMIEGLDITVFGNDAEEGSVAHVPYRRYFDENAANARLIASAPELLAALEHIRMYADTQASTSPTEVALWAQVRGFAQAAIARAKGDA